MKSSIGLVAILAALIVVSLASVAVQEPASVSHGSRLFWNGFLIVLPLILAAFILSRARWALMATVMYGTIGLALDIATIVQESTRGDSHSAVVALSALTGVLNFFLIAIGGRGFLDVLSPSPPTHRAPNPRFPSSRE